MSWPCTDDPTSAFTETTETHCHQKTSERLVSSDIYVGYIVQVPNESASGVIQPFSMLCDCTSGEEVDLLAPY